MWLSYSLITSLRFYHSITSVILSHFILDLRSIYHRPTQSLDSKSQQSSIQFASAIEGNIGATLNVSWASGEERITEDDEIQYSDHPFSTGLAHIGGSSEFENLEEIK